MYAAPPAGAFVAGHLNGVDSVRGRRSTGSAVVRRSRPLQEHGRVVRGGIE
jgi:hypothetical protein